jgi:hypothetical protein
MALRLSRSREHAEAPMKRPCYGAREKSGHPRLYGAVDAEVHLRGEGEDPWRDLKSRPGDGRLAADGEWQIKAERHLLHRYCTSRAFSDLLWATGVQRNAQLAKELVFLGDQSGYGILAENFPRAVQILTGSMPVNTCGGQSL